LHRWRIRSSLDLVVASFGHHRRAEDSRLKQSRTAWKTSETLRSSLTSITERLSKILISESSLRSSHLIIHIFSQTTLVDGLLKCGGTATVERAMVRLFVDLLYLLCEREMRKKKTMLSNASTHPGLKPIGNGARYHHHLESHQVLIHRHCTS